MVDTFFPRSICEPNNLKLFEKQLASKQVLDPENVDFENFTTGNNGFSLGL